VADELPTADRDALVWQGTKSLVNALRLPKWMQLPALGQDVTPVAELVVDALLPHLAVLLDRARQQGRDEGREGAAQPIEEAVPPWADESAVFALSQLRHAAALARGSQTAPSATENAETGGGA
jgi:hypothetical protein